MKHFWLFLVLIVVLIVNTTPQVASRPNMEEMANYAQALKYLEQLEKYYSQIARPR